MGILGMPALQLNSGASQNAFLLGDMEAVGREVEGSGKRRSRQASWDEFGVEHEGGYL